MFHDVRLQEARSFINKCMGWISFNPIKRKTNLNDMLVIIVLKICFKSKLCEELDLIYSVLRDNGYCEKIINSLIARKIKQIQEPPRKYCKYAPFILD